MTDEQARPDDMPAAAGDAGAGAGAAAGAGAGPGADPTSPLYKGEPLDAERGPGLGCFYFQVILLGILLLATPVSVYLKAPDWVSATLLIVTLILLLFAGQTVIFLLRLVAADRRTRRVPRSATARKTVGMIEEDQQARSSDSGSDTGGS